MNRPEVRARLSTQTRKAMARPEVKAKLHAAIKRRWKTPGARRVASIAAKKCQSRPEVRAKRKATLSSQEYLTRLSSWSKASWKTSERQAKAYRPDWSDSEYRTKQSALMRLGWAKRKLKLQSNNTKDS